ncbi:hypothetical protein AMK01_CH02101 [Rhizobium sp. N6212]|nr:hypothetical protein AMK01_CH02101 [Rhizobium sp. N6212]ANK97593.1 hypothetical protein AMK00_CH02103 [Rhizobium sp. N621]ANL03673.1 hypothetical protein AMJ99_CH02131 [Rhizobium esperanzae]ANL09719.1 hypothetical protein AMJ98_CH02053 [Rhizobium sp. N1341]ANL21770.1 hypothetical protein AMJ96_CH02059 [Rhizobium sp. N113]ANM34522.1 hypothetical protein AMK04_CH02133 [Rhizobium sp. N871]ANM40560.1 hypothetical protein AMK03_CH02053 [Rhizobium sp. N741]
MPRRASHRGLQRASSNSPGEYAPHLTPRACCLLLAAAQELFKYKRNEGGFSGWLSTRLLFIPQRSAYQAIEIFNGLDNEMFANFANIRPGALEQIAKAEPDIQALIAERVEAGEIFTAAKVKEIDDAGLTLLDFSAAERSVLSAT